MLKTGTRQELEIVSKTDFGVYLSDGEEKVLLPRKQVPAGAAVGDRMTVFLYRDSQDRMIATVNTPKLMLGQVGRLEVSECTRIGAFLDWGLEKDLFLPFHEQTVKVKPHETHLVAVYMDKSGRLCATMNVYPYLESLDLANVPIRFRPGSWCVGTPYETSGNFGVFVAVEDRYSGLIPKKECPADIPIGKEVNVRVTAIREDGRLDLSLREKAYLQMDEDSGMLLELMEQYGGVLPFTDKASPQTIARETGLSKNAFKRAVGRLLKQGKIEIKETCIRVKGAQRDDKPSFADPSPKSRSGYAREPRAERRKS